MAFLEVAPRTNQGTYTIRVDDKRIVISPALCREIGLEKGVRVSVMFDRANGLLGIKIAPQGSFTLASFSAGLCISFPNKDKFIKHGVYLLQSPVDDIAVTAKLIDNPKAAFAGYDALEETKKAVGKISTPAPLNTDKADGEEQREMDVSEEQTEDHSSRKQAAIRAVQRKRA